MGQVTWTPGAQNDLNGIFRYISRNNEVAAARVVRGITEYSLTLETFPELGRRYGDSRGNVRLLIYRIYRIAYVVQADGDVLILGVYHPSQNINLAVFEDYL